jgi:23S rRNA (guanine745-N1)-methyltransferase
MSYQCPLCFLPLALTNRSFRCENNHQFDLAKEGYVNLMPAHHKRSKDPGDNKEMTQARRRFLEANHYQPMCDQVAKTCVEWVKDKHNVQILDIGCGEGYYTEHIAKELSEAKIKSDVFGLDISKVAIRYAAKRYPNCQFSVASSHRLPFADHSLDAMVRIYAPCKAIEMQRVLKENGVLITVTPASRHLYQLREEIYEQVRLHTEEPEILEGFTLESQNKLSYEMTLTGSQANDLLQMTPFAWKASPELKARLIAAEHYLCEADFMVSIYRKND